MAERRDHDRRVHFEHAFDRLLAVKLERVEATDRKAKKPRIVESHGEAPEQYPDWDE